MARKLRKLAPEGNPTCEHAGHGFRLLPPLSQHLSSSSADFRERLKLSAIDMTRLLRGE